MIDKKQYEHYVETAKFWREVEQRISNCIVFIRCNTHCDKDFVELVILTLRSAEKICSYRAKIMCEKASAWETLFGEDSK